MTKNRPVASQKNQKNTLSAGQALYSVTRPVNTVEGFLRSQNQKSTSRISKNKTDSVSATVDRTKNPHLLRPKNSPLSARQALYSATPLVQTVLARHKKNICQLNAERLLMIEEIANRHETKNPHLVSQKTSSSSSSSSSALVANARSSSSSSSFSSSSSSSPPPPPPLLLLLLLALTPP